MNRFITLLLFVTTFSIGAQSKETNNNCTIKMTKEAFISKTFNLDCAALKDKKFTQFKIKVPKHKTVLVKGNVLNIEAKSYIKKASIGDVIVIFDIKDSTEEKIPPIVITIVK